LLDRKVEHLGLGS